MLQQTQTERVRSYYRKFLLAHPTIKSLSQATLPEVLGLWSGLGYNRRARALLNLAREVQEKFRGRLPRSSEALLALPGVGPYTASAVAAFAFEEPTIFIETNIRTVFTYVFFKDRKSVSDEEILPLIARTLYPKDIRRWYYALMDYGVFLKRKVPRINLKSSHYRPQSRFKGSNREIRGKILRALTSKTTLTLKAIRILTGEPLDRIELVLLSLQKEGFVKIRNGRIGIVSD